MERSNGRNPKIKAVVLVIMALAISLCLTLAAVYLYRNANASDTGNRMIQNVTYMLMLLNTFIFIKISKKPLREFGLFKEKMPKQILTGIIIGAAFLLIMFFLGWRPGLKENFLYIALSQILVAFSEELLFRGFVLTMLRDVMKSKNKAVLVAALLFGLWHYPLGQNVGQVIITFIIGAVYGALRTVFDEKEDTIGVPALAVAHWINNVMM